MSERTDYYDVLGVGRDADDDTIRRAYHKLAKRYHPDLCKEPGAARRFQRICEAYQALTSPSRRQRYDRAVNGQPPVRPRGPGGPPKAGQADAPDDHDKGPAWGQWKSAPYRRYRTSSRRWEKRMTVVLFWLLAAMSTAYLIWMFYPPGPSKEDIAGQLKKKAAAERLNLKMKTAAERLKKRAAAAAKRVHQLGGGQAVAVRARFVDANTWRPEGDRGLEHGAYGAAIRFYDKAIRGFNEIEVYIAQRREEANAIFRKVDGRPVYGIFGGQAIVPELGEVEDLLRKAREHSEARRRGQAIDLREQAISAYAEIEARVSRQRGEAKRFRSKAEAAREHVRTLGSEQEVCQQLDEADALQRNAEECFDIGAYRDAVACYQDVIDKYGEVQAYYTARKREAEKKREVEELKIVADREWGHVRRFDPAQGMARRFETVRALRGKADEYVRNHAHDRAIACYREAIDKCGEIERYEATRIPARKARKAYRVDLWWVNVSSLRAFDLKAWLQVEKAHEDAVKSCESGAFGRAESQWVRARNLLGALEARRKAAMSLPRARKSFGAGALRDALKAVEQVLRLNPKSADARALRKAILAKVFVKLDCGNGATMDLAWIPRGTFLMGSPKDETGRNAAEGPQHEVTVSRAFYMGRTEVTREQWKAVVGTEPWKDDPGFQPGPGLPATHMTWQDAMRFCEKLSDKLRRKVRLPTEAQWEYACRAGTRTSFSFGHDERLLKKYGNASGFWYDKKKGKRCLHPLGELDGSPGIAAVKKFAPNPWGLYGMHGNVAEWCSDWWDENYYARAEKVDPTGPAATSCSKHRPDPCTCYAHVHRGGSWYSLRVECRSADRGNVNMAEGSGACGFRVVVVVQLPGP